MFNGFLTQNLNNLEFNQNYFLIKKVINLNYLYLNLIMT